MSLRASVTSGLFLDNVFVPERMRLPEAAGLKSATELPQPGALRHRLGRDRRGGGLPARGADLCRRTHPVRTPVGGHAERADQTGRHGARISTAQLLALQLGRLKEAGTLRPEQISLAKWNNCRMALDVARECRDLLGAAGITTEHVAIRHALNLESVITYEGTETVHQLVVGRALTGLNAF